MANRVRPISTRREPATEPGRPSTRSLKPLSYAGQPR